MIVWNQFTAPIVIFLIVMALFRLSDQWLNRQRRRHRDHLPVVLDMSRPWLAVSFVDELEREKFLKNACYFTDPDVPLVAVTRRQVRHWSSRQFLRRCEMTTYYFQPRL